MAVLICGQELNIHRIERDEALIAQLIELERRFWQLVETDTAPAADGSTRRSWTGPNSGWTGCRSTLASMRICS